MSGELEKAERRAFGAGDERHVALCLAQGGFARIVALGDGRVAHVNLHGGIYRHDPDGKPPRQTTARNTAPVAEDRPLPSLTPLLSKRVEIGGRRFTPPMIHALHLVVAVGEAGLSARPLAKALKISRSGAVGHLASLRTGGFVSQIARAPGPHWEAVYGGTKAGRDLLARIEALTSGALSKRDVALLTVLARRTLQPRQISARLALCLATTREALKAASDLGLVVSVRRGRQHFWRSTPYARRALELLEPKSAA